MVSLAALMTFEWSKPLGGVVCLSGMQALEIKDPDQLPLESIRQTPLFLYHGKDDTTLPLEGAKLTYEYLKTKVYDGDYSKNFTFKTQSGLGHSISSKEITSI